MEGDQPEPQFVNVHPSLYPGAQQQPGAMQQPTGSPAPHDLHATEEVKKTAPCDQQQAGTKQHPVQATGKTNATLNPPAKQIDPLAPLPLPLATPIKLGIASVNAGDRDEHHKVENLEDFIPNLDPLQWKP